MQQGNPEGATAPCPNFVNSRLSFNRSAGNRALKKHKIDTPLPSCEGKQKATYMGSSSLKQPKGKGPFTDYSTAQSKLLGQLLPKVYGTICKHLFKR